MTQTPSSPTLVAVQGATGQQGGAVAAALLERGVRVRGLTRDPASAAGIALAGAGAEVVAAEPTDADSLAEAFAGASHVFAMTTPAAGGPAGEVVQGEAMVTAAERAGVSFVCFSSVGGAERHTGVPHFDSKRRVEERLQASGLGSVILRPVFFMDNLAGTGVEDGTVVVRLPLPADVPLQMVAVQDIGRIAAAVLLEPGRVEGAVEIAGDELTGEQVAEVFGRAAGLPARYEALPLQVLGEDEDMRSMFDWFTRLPAYRADFALTRELDPGLLDLPGWLAATGWSRSAGG